MLRRLIPENIELALRLASGLGRVRADPVQLEQVILNLVVNSRDVMPDGGRLVIETANVDLDGDAPAARLSVPPGPYVTLTVTDSGPGMDPDTLRRVFEPFFTTKEPGRGTGLGLATVYGIVTQSGGDVGVWSEPGRGTTVRVYLPRVEDQASEMQAPSRRLRAGMPAGSGSVLVAEDEDAVRILTGEILRRSGYRVLEASGGPEALAMCESRTESIDVLVTDVVMPRLSGRDLAARRPSATRGSGSSTSRAPPRRAGRGDGGQPGHRLPAEALHPGGPGARRRHPPRHPQDVAPDGVGPRGVSPAHARTGRSPCERQLRGATHRRVGRTRSGRGRCRGR
jgi:hypothetical protein